jgi:RNA polymerase sigma factor (sigma-70 family)
LELIKGLKERDQKAFVYLYNQYSGALYSIILQIVPHQELANDILHDTFMHVWKKIETFDRDRSILFTWMLTIARTLSVDTIRSKAYQDSLINQGAPEVIHLNVDNKVTELAVDNFGLKKRIGALKPADRSLIDLCYFKGYSQEEISDIEDIPAVDIKSRLGAAFVQLRKHLK